MAESLVSEPNDITVIDTDVGRVADRSEAQRRFEEASRHIYASSAPLWDRRWRLIVTVGELAPKEREGLRRALFWHR